MIKWFAYIVLLLLLAPHLSFAKKKGISPVFKSYNLHLLRDENVPADTSTTKKQQERDNKKKIKEIAKARRLPKPEKIDENGKPAPLKKPKRQRRPPGLEQPPEIPRRSGD
jgi:hypothetical protein